ncbi:MAG: pyruvate dehydrogenase complex E1 component subunit beta [Alphaproteobacteria bacterium]|jgi:pyruvate dehydrogenase E1 component beta subunit|nr:pyruvate dehydrogenase complex E1 component subunit beta [Alphaproteobacteria bacterium]
MATNILMPALSPTMESGKLARWCKKIGDEVRSGDILAEIETDKATMEVEAVDEGILTSILVPENSEDVAVNSVIAILDGDGSEDAASTSASTEDIPVAPLHENVMASSTSAAEPVVAQAANKEVISGRMMTVREALRDAMAEEMRRNGDVFVMGEEVAQYQGAYKVTQGLLDEFGDRRVIDTPITEHGFAGLGVGAAFAGLRPVVEFMTFNFAMQAIDHIVNSAAKTLYMSGGAIRCPIVFRGPNGAAARVAAQHSQDYAAWYAHLPGLKVVMPYTASDFKGLLKSAIRDPNPVVFLENEILYGKSFEVPDDDEYLVPIGKARLAREGEDATIVSFGIGMTYAEAAADILAEQNIHVEIIDLRTIRPMDFAAVLASVRKTHRCVTVEEGFPQGSVGSEISARLMEQGFDDLDAPVIRITGKDVPMPYAANLEKLALPTVDEVVSAVKSVCYR